MKVRIYGEPLLHRMTAINRVTGLATTRCLIVFMLGTLPKGTPRPEKLCGVCFDKEA